MRRELEEVLAHEPGRNPIPTSECFDLAFGPSPAFLCLHSSNKTGAAKAGNIGRVPLIFTVGESLDWGDAMIIASAASDGVDERCFAVRAGALAKEGGVFPRESGEAVSGTSLHERNQARIASRYAIEEL